MNSIKKIIAVSMAVLMLFAFSACSQKEYTDTVVTVTDADGNAVTDAGGKVVTSKVSGESTSNETTSADEKGVETSKGSSSENNNDSKTTTKKSSNDSKTTTKKSTTKKETTTLKSTYNLTIKAQLPTESDDNGKNYRKVDVHVYIGDAKTGKLKELINSTDEDGKKGEKVELNGGTYKFTQKIGSGNEYREIKIVIDVKNYSDYFKFNKDVTYKVDTNLGVESADGGTD